MPAAPTIRVFQTTHRRSASFRAVVAWPDGRKTWLRRGSQQAAQAAADALVAAEQSGRATVQAAVDEYCRLRLEHGAWSPETDRAVRIALNELAPAPELPAAALDRSALLAYLERTRHLALGTRKSRWGTVTGFLRFCVAEGWLERNPSELIDRVRKPWVGKRAQRQLGRGKAQLRNTEEVQRYISAALQLDDSEERVASLLPLLCNLRSGEALHLTAGDVDLQVGVLYIRDAEARDDDDDGWAVKSIAGRRTVNISPLLVEDLAALTHNRPPGHLVVGTWRRVRGDHRKRVPHRCHWLAALVERVCAVAEVRVVKPHGLRGTYMTVLSVLGKVAPMDIARLVGHGDAGATARAHYLGAMPAEPALPTAAPNWPTPQTATGFAQLHPAAGATEVSR